MGVVLDLSFPFTVLPAAVDHSVLEATYVVSASAIPQTTTLAFSDLLGVPPVVNVIVSDNSVELDLTTSDGVVTLLPPGPAFLRGDGNHDGSLGVADVVACLNRVFGAIPAGSCADAEDANDDGVLDVSDGVFLVEYLFGGGAPLAAPFAGCGPMPPTVSPRLRRVRLLPLVIEYCDSRIDRATGGNGPWPRLARLLNLGQLNWAVQQPACTFARAHLILAQRATPRQ